MLLLSAMMMNVMASDGDGMAMAMASDGGDEKRTRRGILHSMAYGHCKFVALNETM